MITLQDCRNRALGGDIRRREHQRATRLEDAIDLRHHMHRIGGQVFDQLTTKHGIEVFVLIGKPIALGVEQVDVAFEVSDCTDLCSTSPAGP